MDRIQRLENKRVEIQENIRRWAIEENILKAGEQLSFELRIVRTPVAVGKVEVDGMEVAQSAAIALAEELGLNDRSNKFRGAIVWSFAAMRIGSLQELLTHSAYEFRELRNFGVVRLEVIRRKLAERGMSLKGDENLTAGTTLESLYLRPQLCRTLCAGGIGCVEELVAREASELLAVFHLSKKDLKGTRTGLARKGLRLKGE